MLARSACLVLISVCTVGALAPNAAAGAAHSRDCAAVSRRAALASGAAALFASSSATFAAETAAVTPGDCRRDCFRECNALAPGNQAYCAAQCDSYCEGVGALGKDDVVRSDLSDAEASAAAPDTNGKDCSTYKTEKAVKYCEQTQKEKAAALASAAALSESSPNHPLGVYQASAGKNDLNKNLGIFGDSGVSYSNGVEDLFATVFGAKQQNKNINKADIGAFTDDIAKAGQAAFFGK